MTPCESSIEPRRFSPEGAELLQRLSLDCVCVSEVGMSIRPDLGTIVLFGTDGQLFASAACVHCGGSGRVPARRATESEATKYDEGKPPLDLFPPEALIEIGKVLGFGANRYGRYNWREGMDWGRMLAAALRHLNAWNAGEDTDPDSGLPHLAHAGCCITFLIAYEKSGIGTDDRWKGGNYCRGCELSGRPCRLHSKAGSQ